jgi:hypothetical protein
MDSGRSAEWVEAGKGSGQWDVSELWATISVYQHLPG